MGPTTRINNNLYGEGNVPTLSVGRHLYSHESILLEVIDPTMFSVAFYHTEGRIRYVS
jgi:hypothetical protein